MTTWDDYLPDIDDEVESSAGEVAGDLHDQEEALADAEMEAILAGDVDAAESLHAQWKATEEAADHADWGAQEVEWAAQSTAEVEADATDAAEAASMHLPDSAEKISGMAGIASQAAAGSIDAAMSEYQQSIAALETADAADAATTADEPYDADPDTAAVYDADGGDDDDGGDY